jgi:hypothetical protein
MHLPRSGRASGAFPEPFCDWVDPATIAATPGSAPVAVMMCPPTIVSALIPVYMMAVQDWLKSLMLLRVGLFIKKG